MSDLECRMSDLGCRMSDVGSRMSDVGSRMSDVGKLVEAYQLGRVNSGAALLFEHKRLAAILLNNDN